MLVAEVEVSYDSDGFPLQWGHHVIEVTERLLQLLPSLDLGVPSWQVHVEVVGPGQPDMLDPVA